MPISLKNTASILPYIRYSPQANTMVIAGEDNKPRKIPFIGKAFVVDVENGMPGWLLLGEGLRDWKPAPLDSAAPDKTYKRGFSVLFFAPKLLGSAEAFEMCASTGAHMSFCERLYNECEPEFGKGNVPVIKITEAEPIKVGKGKSRELYYKIIKYVPRAAAITEALAKLKAANAAPNKNADTSGAANTDDGGDDFDEPEDVTKEEATTKPEEASTRKPKGREKAKPEQTHSSDILDDPIPY
jgi:hypothetical protein